MTMKWVFDYKPADVFWCTADVGWVTGHSYVTYGPLAYRAPRPKSCSKASRFLPGRGPVLENDSRS